MWLNLGKSRGISFLCLPLTYTKNDRYKNGRHTNRGDFSPFNAFFFVTITSVLVTHFPSPALPGSGIMGMISARFFKAPLMIYGTNVLCPIEYYKIYFLFITTNSLDAEE